MTGAVRLERAGIRGLLRFALVHLERGNPEAVREALHDAIKQLDAADARDEEAANASIDW